MRIRVELDERGMVPDRYAKHADAAHLYQGTPTTSFPFAVEGIPDGARTVALAFVDFDSIPVCGFPWIHWCAANIPAGEAEGGTIRFGENASNLGEHGMVQGRNSSAARWAGGSTDPLLACRYNGPQPPDRTHVYTLAAFALDTELPLREGFWMSEMVDGMRGHVIDHAVADLPARA